MSALALARRAPLAFRLTKLHASAAVLLALIAAPQTAAAQEGTEGPAEPATAEPAKAEPAKAEPAKAEPAEAEPAKAEPATAEPAKAEPAKAEPASGQHASAEHASAEHAGAASEEDHHEKAGHDRGEKGEEEPPWDAHVDIVAGGTTAPVLTEGKAFVPANVYDSTRITTATFLMGLERQWGGVFRLGARIPLIAAELESRTGLAHSRTLWTAGNLELEATYVLAEGHNWILIGGFGLALPTAGGTEPLTRAEIAAEPERRFDYKGYQTFAAVHAANAIRGAYDGALFEPGNIGFIPKLISSVAVTDQFTITGTLKFENMIQLTDEADEMYINELVAGVRAGYRVLPYVEPGVHLWMRELHEQTHHDENWDLIGVVEPYVRFPLQRVKPMASLILPFAGEFAHDQTFGVRASVSAEF